jgi:hypothetical protein
VLYVPTSAVQALAPFPQVVILMFFDLPWLIAVAQGFSKLVIEVNIEAHGVKECLSVYINKIFIHENISDQ